MIDSFMSSRLLSLYQAAEKTLSESFEGFEGFPFMLSFSKNSEPFFSDLL
jgi:hypothetical protein